MKIHVPGEHDRRRMGVVADPSRRPAPQPVEVEPIPSASIESAPSCSMPSLSTPKSSPAGAIVLLVLLMFSGLVAAVDGLVGWMPGMVEDVIVRAASELWREAPGGGTSWLNGPNSPRGSEKGSRRS